MKNLPLGDDRWEPFSMPALTLGDLPVQQVCSQPPRPVSLAPVHAFPDRQDRIGPTRLYVFLYHVLDGCVCTLLRASHTLK